MIEHTLNWYNGEIFEGKFILGFGIFLLFVALLFYHYGYISTAKALFIPFLTISLFFTAVGIGGVYSNSKKVDLVEEIYHQDQYEFIKNEIKRVEGFQYLYPMSLAISLVCFIVAIFLLYFVENVHFRAIAIALIVFGSAFALIDYFSKHRANIYYQELLNYIENKGI